MRFFFPVVAVILCFELFIRLGHKELFTEQKLEKAYQSSGKTYQWVSKINHPNKVLLLGSSSILYGLSCTQLNEFSKNSSAFINLGGDARDPIETYFILKQIDLTDVKSAYMGLDAWVYTRSYYKNRNSYLYLDFDLKNAFRYSFERDLRLFPLRYKRLIESLFPVSNIKNVSEQPVPIDFGSSILRRKPTNFNDPVYNKFQLEKWGWADLQFEYLQKITQLCKSRNISFIAFYPPKRFDFVTDYKTKCADIHASFLQKLSDVGFIYPIIGSFDQLQSYGDSLFADAYHLNARGQKVYSELFFRLINE